MRRVLAYERQCRTYAELSAATRRTLAVMANGTPSNGAAARAGSVSPWTHLVREWNGRTDRVEVLDGGYRFDGKTYPSLTVMATSSLCCVNLDLVGDRATCCRSQTAR